MKTSYIYKGMGEDPRPKKALGQNFLMHQATADRIAAAAGLAPGEIVLEIGPGTGMLTRSLLARGVRVIAVEADQELIPVLTESFAAELETGQLSLISGDIRTFDLSSLPASYAVVANIPYYITGEIIRFLLSAAHQPQSVTLLVQKEVAERIVRDPKESLLSLSVKVFGTPGIAFTVPRGAFRPAPKVDSAVLTITRIHRPFPRPEDEERFFAVLHAGFAHKRKRLAKNLEALFAPEFVSEALTRLGIGKDVRAEEVPLSVWMELARAAAH